MPRRLNQIGLTLIILILTMGKMPGDGNCGYLDIIVSLSRNFTWHEFYSLIKSSKRAGETGCGTASGKAVTRRCLVDAGSLMRIKKCYSDEINFTTTRHNDFFL